MPAGQIRKAPGKRRPQFLNSIDALCTTPAHDARAFIDALTSDLGNPGHITTTQAALVERCAVLVAMARDYEVRRLQGERVDLSEYVRLAQGLKRIIQVLGVKRIPGDATVTLERYIVENYSKPEPEGDDE